MNGELVAIPYTAHPLSTGVVTLGLSKEDFENVRVFQRLLVRLAPKAYEYWEKPHILDRIPRKQEWRPCRAGKKGALKERSPFYVRTSRWGLESFLGASIHDFRGTIKPTSHPLRKR
jgi:hypothetical protein